MGATDAAQEPLARAERVSFWKVKFVNDVPENGSTPLVTGALSVYGDRLSLVGEPGNVSTFVRSLARGSLTVEREWPLDQIDRAVSWPCGTLVDDFDMLVITLVNGDSFGFMPMLTWKKEEKKRNIAEVREVWRQLHKLLGARGKVKDVDSLAALQRTMGIAPKSPYELALPPVSAPQERRQKLSLDFGAVPRAAILKGKGSQSAEGMTYRLNGRVYTDSRTLRSEPVWQVSDDVRVWRDAFGEPVLDVYTQIPTFDVYDREWDGALHEYLCFDGKDVDLVVTRGGYNLAYIEVYHGLKRAPAALRAWLERMGMPTGSVTWL